MKSCSHLKNQAADEQLLSFPVWQAKQLSGRDLFIGAFLLNLMVLYSIRIVPQVCSTILQTTAEAPPVAHAWHVVCCTLPNRLAGNVVANTSKVPANIAPPGALELALAVAAAAATAAAAAGPAAVLQFAGFGSAASKAVATAKLMLWALITFGSVNLLSRDPMHLIRIPLRIGLLSLLLLPLPYPNFPILWRSVAAAAARRQRTHVRLAASSSSSSIVDCSLIGWYYPSYYWRYPTVRNIAIALQRIVPLAAVAVAAGNPDSLYYKYRLGLSVWATFGQYTYAGWKQYMLMLPRQLHLLVSFCEWLLLYSTTLRMTPSATSAAGSSGPDWWFAASHFVGSLLLVVVLPSVGVGYIEQAQHMQYGQHHDNDRDSSQMDDSMGHAEHGNQQQGGRVHSLHPRKQTLSQQQGQLPLEQQHGEKDQHASHSSAADWPQADVYDDAASAAPDTGKQQRRHFSAAGKQIYLDHRSLQRPASNDDTAFLDSAAVQFLADIESSMSLAVPATTGIGTETLDSCDLAVITTDHSFRSLGSGSAAGAETLDSCDQAVRTLDIIGDDLSGLRSSIANMLGQDAAAAVYMAAAAAATATGPYPGAMPFYTSMAHSVTASIKVHTSHSQVSELSPLLATSLTAGLAAAQPFAVDAACFEGCVQLLANIYSIRAAAAAASASQDNAKLGCNAFDGDCSAIAAELLANVQHSIRQMQVVIPCRSHDAAERSVEKPAAAAAAAAVVALEPAGYYDHSDGETYSEPSQPDIDVVFGNSTASIKRATAAAAAAADHARNSSSSKVAGAVSLLHCEPVCLTAYKSQRISLILRLDSQQHLQHLQHQQQQDMPVRLIAFQDGTVVLDDVIQLQSTISITVPPLSSGTLQLALLPPNKSSSSSSSNITAVVSDRQPGQSSMAIATTAAGPLLLVPLIVLPETAAGEVQQHWHRVVSAAAAAAADPAAAAAAAAWEDVMLPLVTDMAYVISACRAVAGDAAAAAAASVTAVQPGLPDHIRPVFRHVLAHLACCGMWHVMQALLQIATTAQQQQQRCCIRKTCGEAQQLDQQNDAALTQSSYSSSSSSSKGASCAEPAVQHGDADIGIDAGIDVKTGYTSAKDGSSECSALQRASSSNAGVSCCKSETSSSSSVITVPAASLLWGFANRALEASYQAAAFSNTATLDFVALLFNAAVGVGCYFAKGAVDQRAHAGNIGRLLMITNQLLAAAVSTIGPLGVILLRLHVVRQLRDLDHDPARQLKPWIIDGSSSNSGDRKAATLVAAGQAKRQVMMCWLACMLCWCGLLLAGIVVEPVMLSKVWTQYGWSQIMTSVLGFALKGWFYQVPFKWLWRMMLAEIGVNVYGCFKHAVVPTHWLPVRYIPCFIIAVTVAAMQQVQGRRQFCNRHGIQVQGNMSFGCFTVRASC